MAVDPRLALMGADPSGPANAFMISRDNARAGVFQEQKMAADAAKSAAEARSAKLGQLANFAFRVAREPIQTRGPLLEQAKMAAISLYGNDPQVTQILSQVTPENVEGYASALVSIKDQLDAGKTDADIANVYNTMSNRDRATTSGINVDNAQIGNYGASTANYRDQIRSRQGQDQASAYGQLDKNYVMGPDGKASMIPGYVPPPSKSGSNVTVDPVTGALTVGPAGGKPPNETQSKDIVFLTRAMHANEGIDPGYSPSWSAEQSARLPFGIGNQIAGNNPEYQSQRQAWTDFVMAVMRKDSGASITDNEWENAYRTWLPQAGDSPQVLAQKAASRQVAMEAIRAGLPVGMGPQMPGSGIVAPSGDLADVDAIVGLGR